jgi:hypothetical protein
MGSNSNTSRCRCWDGFLLYDAVVAEGEGMDLFLIDNDAE